MSLFYGLKFSISFSFFLLLLFHLNASTSLFFVLPIRSKTSGVWHLVFSIQLISITFQTTAFDFRLSISISIHTHIYLSFLFFLFLFSFKKNKYIHNFVWASIIYGFSVLGLRLDVLCTFYKKDRLFWKKTELSAAILRLAAHERRPVKGSQLSDHL